jgi:uncharacterized protein YjbI with pentapeptide repeats
VKYWEIIADNLSKAGWSWGYVSALGFLTVISASVAANAQANAGELNPAEQWIIERVTTGKEANLDTALNTDLTKRFPKQEDRKISAYFLENLLMDTLSGVKLHRHGVQIINAIIDDPIDLKNAQIPREVSLDHCIFEGPVDFRGADFASSFSARWATFQNTETGASFSDMKVGGDAFFNAGVFKGPVNFGSADIVGVFSVQGAKFQNKERAALFWKMKVGGDAFFDASFEGPVNFLGTDIAGNFQAGALPGGGAKFQKGAPFVRMKIGGDATFTGAMFEGSVSFTGTDIAGDLSAGATFRNKERGASFNHVKVRGDASFNHASFEGPVDLRYADFGLLNVSGASWPKDPGQFHLEGMSYKTILAEEPKSHERLLNLVSQATYSADVYSRLEEFFLRQGYRADADEAFIAGKRRERDEYFRSGDWSGWLRSWLLYLLVGYGRQPWRAGLASAVVIALGCVLFSPNKMEPQKPEDTPRIYSRFWYSLNLFLPVVDLQAGKVWKPKANQTFLRNYMRVHILLGWILVPLVLAALTGLIK